MWNINVLKTLYVILDIDLIQDEANEFSPHRWPHSEVQPLRENLVAKVKQAQAANPPTSKPTDTNMVETIPGCSSAPISSRSTPSTTLVTMAKVQKLKAKMATLLHHIQPWMQSSIAEGEERLERKMS